MRNPQQSGTNGAHTYTQSLPDSFACSFTHSFACLRYAKRPTPTDDYNSDDVNGWLAMAMDTSEGNNICFGFRTLSYSQVGVYICVYITH